MEVALWDLMGFTCRLREAGNSSQQKQQLALMPLQSQNQLKTLLAPKAPYLPAQLAALQRPRARAASCAAAPLHEEELERDPHRPVQRHVAAATAPAARASPAAPNRLAHATAPPRDHSADPAHGYASPLTWAVSE